MQGARVYIRCERAGRWPDRGGAALSIKLRIRRPLQEVRECDVKASIAEWQQHLGQDDIEMIYDTYI